MDKIELLTIPILETPRLTMRGHRSSDFESVAAMWGDFEVARHISGKPSTAEESWARMLRYAGLWHFLGYGYWALEDKATGKFLGEVGLANFHREMDPPLGDIPEAGWVLSPAAQGKGYATEAAAALTNFAFTQNIPTVRAHTLPETNASTRVLTKCGFEHLGEVIDPEDGRVWRWEKHRTQSPPTSAHK